MNFEDLANKIINTISDWIITINEDNNYSSITINDCYYNSKKDMKSLRKIIKKTFNLDKINNDIMKSFCDDYFIFKFNKIYIIINVSNDYDLSNHKIDFNIIKVFNRNEALTYRYSY